jgi:hypothetical protein
VPFLAAPACGFMWNIPDIVPTKGMS